MVMAGGVALVAIVRGGALLALDPSRPVGRPRAEPYCGTNPLALMMRAQVAV
jgi:hypothetical protein